MKVEPVIRVENLGKRYRLGQLEPYRTLRDKISRAVRAPSRSASPVQSGNVSSGPNPESGRYVWALRNVSLKINAGEVVGFIGRNGAGKTTLLKILSRITEPTEGRAEIRGRVGSLLEVGTGFHPELTGRENVYLNGAVLGMRKTEIDRKFDEIVAFAELERFMETPVKRYSSGMYVRLAFAVAAHLEPEILLVDEVLAVGDASFQEKCLGKMNEVAREGRTVLFVSHNMVAIQNLCQRCLLLDQGGLVASGDTTHVISKYLEGIQTRLGVPVSERDDRGGTGEAVCVRISFLEASGIEVAFLYPGQPCHIQLDFESQTPIQKDVHVGVGIDGTDGVRLLTLYSEFSGQSFTMTKKRLSFRCTLSEGLNLRPGSYLLSSFLGNRYGAIDIVLAAGRLEIREADFYGTGLLPDRTQGPILVPHAWSLQ